MENNDISIHEEGMKERDVILYIIRNCQDRPAFGRTSLQKVAYFVGRAMDRDLGHRAYFYGPFASTLERETQALVLSDLVEERVRTLGFANAGGFEAKQYEYKVTPSGEERIARLMGQYPSEAKKIDLVIEALVENAGRLDQRLLSAAAKVDYIAKQERRPVSIHDVQLAAEDLGWRLDETQVSSVVGMLNNLGFVEMVKGS